MWTYCCPSCLDQTFGKARNIAREKCVGTSMGTISSLQASMKDCQDTSCHINMHLIQIRTQ